MRLITINREFGSGGRELAKRLADELGVAYYDKEIVEEISKRLEMDEHYIETTLNRRFTMDYHYTFSHTFNYVSPMACQSTSMLIEQHKILHSIAEKGEDCIIVGRCADVVLSEYSPFKIFVYSDEESKVTRCMNRNDKDENLYFQEIAKKIKQIDKARAHQYSMIADQKWGDMHAYDLCINTSGAQIKDMVPIIRDYINKWYENK